MKTTLLCLTLLAAAALSGDAVAQGEALSLDLDQALELALEKSYSARTLKLRLLEAEQNVVAAKGRFKTNLNLDLDTPSYSESVQGRSNPGELPQYTTYGSREWRGRLALNQPLPTDGRLSLNADVYQRRDTVYDEQLDQTEKSKSFFNSLRLDLDQPLFTPNSLKLGLERAELNLEQSRRNFTRTQLDVVYNVTRAFFDYLKAQRGLQIARDELSQQEGAYDLAKTKFEAGLIPEVEALQMEVDLSQSRNDVLVAEGRLALDADRFKIIVGLPLDVGVEVTASTEPSLYDVDAEKALEHALRHRAEIRDAASSLRLAQITLDETDARVSVKGELRAFYDLTGISNRQDGSVFELWDSSLDDLSRRPGNKGFTFSLLLPLWDSGVNAAEVAAARAVLERQDLDQEESRRLVTQQVKQALTGLNEARARLQVLEKSRDVAQRSLEISQGRFSNGDITSQELALDRDRLTQARQAYLDAYIQFQLAGADLKRQTLYDFENDRSMVQ